MISYGRQYIDNSDVKAVSKVLKSDWLTQGPQIAKFEEALKKKFSAKYCSVVSNGTAALHLAGKALGWKKGDIVLTTPITFLATSNCILYSRATPNFVDICPISYNIDVNKLEKKIKNLNVHSKKVVAIIATDYAGHPCDWKSLKEISLKYKVKLINDNCHAIGAKYNNDKNYAVKYADIVTHSYHPVKNITSGEGGAILTNQKKIYEKIRLLRSHGITKDPKQMKVNHGPWYYEMQELGYNYRITDIQCALGINQLKKIDKFIKRRREIAKIYNGFFSKYIAFSIPTIRENSSHAYHLYPLQIDFDEIKISKKQLFNSMKSKNINLQVHYVPVHLHPYYKKMYNFKVGDFPVAEKFYKNEVSLPIYFSLKDKQIFNIINLIKKFCNN
tara:strand:+ start:483 stop:1646 length:1164 start_codon:yes stop_codon:yes gene_type:complete